MQGEDLLARARARPRSKRRVRSRGQRRDSDSAAASGMAASWPWRMGMRGSSALRLALVLLSLALTATQARAEAEQFRGGILLAAQTPAPGKELRAAENAARARSQRWQRRLERSEGEGRDASYDDAKQHDQLQNKNNSKKSPQTKQNNQIYENRFEDEIVQAYQNDQQNDQQTDENSQKDQNIQEPHWEGGEEEAMNMLEVWMRQVERLEGAESELLRTLRAEADQAWAEALRSAQHFQTLVASASKIPIKSGDYRNGNASTPPANYATTKTRLLDEASNSEAKSIACQNSRRALAQEAQARQQEMYAVQNSKAARWVMCIRAEALLRVGDKPRAQEAFQELYDHSFSRSPPWEEVDFRVYVGTTTARIAFERGLAREAAEIFARVLKEAPYSLEANRGLGLSYDALLTFSETPSDEPSKHMKGYMARVKSAGSPSATTTTLLKKLSTGGGPVQPSTTFHDVDENIPAGILSQMVLVHLQRAISAGCNDTHVMIRVGALLAERQEWEGAARSLSRAVKLFPNSAPAHLHLARVLRARSYILRHEFLEGSSDAHISKLEADNLMRRAITHFQQAVWLDKTALEARIDLAKALLEVNRVEEAAKTLEFGTISAHPTPAATKTRVKGQDPSKAKTGLISAQTADQTFSRVLFAKALLGQGRLREAAEVVDRELAPLLKQEKQQELQGSILLLMGEVKLAQGAFEDANKIFSQVESLMSAGNEGSSSMRLRALVGQGRTSLSVDNLSKALESFRSAVQINQIDVQSNIGLARTLVALGRSSEAAEFFWTAFQGQYENNLGSVDLHLEAAEALNEAKLPVEAGAVLQAAVRLWPRNPAPMKALARSSASDTVAVTAWQRALRAEPTCLDCLLALGKLHMDAGRIHRALESFAAAHHLNPKHAATHLLTGRAQARLEQLDQAEDSLNTAITLAELKASDNDDDVALEARIDLATVQVRRGEPERSLELLNEAKLLDPLNSIVHRSLALLLAAQGQPALAKEHELEASRLTSITETLIGLPVQGPRLPVPQSWKSTPPTTPGRTIVTRTTSNRTISSRESSTLSESRVALAAKEGVPISHDVGGLMSLGLMFASQQLLEVAVDCFEHVVAHDYSPLVPAAHVELGIALLTLGNRQRAVYSFNQALARLDPNHPAHLRALLWAAHAEGEDKRLSLLRRATDQHPHESAAFHALGAELSARRPRASLSQVHEAFSEAIHCVSNNMTRGAADTFYRFAKAHEEYEPEDLEVVAEYLTRTLTFTSYAQRSKAKHARNELVVNLEKYPWNWAFESIDAMHARVLLHLGSVLRRLGRAQDASDLLVDAIDEGAGKAALRELSMVFALNGQLGPALWFARVSGDDSELNDLHLRRVLLRLGQEDEAARLRPQKIDELMERGLFDDALQAAKSMKGEQSKIAKILAVRSKASGAADYACELASAKEDVPRALEAISSISSQAERVYALSQALQHPSVGHNFLQLAEQYSSKHSVIALARGQILIRENIINGNYDHFSVLESKALEVLGAALSLEFEEYLKTSDTEQDAFAAHLLIAEYLVGGKQSMQLSYMSPTLGGLHIQLARIRWRQMRHKAAAIHAWWALSSGRFGALSDHEQEEMHMVAAWSCQSSLSTVTQSMIPRVQALVARHFSMASSTAGPIWVLLQSKQLQSASFALTTALAAPSTNADASRSACVLAAKGHLELYSDTDVSRRTATVNFDQAVQSLRSIPNNHKLQVQYCVPDGFLEYADILQREGKTMEAAEVYSLLMEKLFLNAAQMSQVRYARGSLEFHLGHFTAAVNLLEHPSLENHIGASNNLGAALIKQGEFKRAVLRLDKVLVMCDERADRVDLCKQSARVNLAYANAELGRSDVALVHARSALKALDEGRSQEPDGGGLRPVLACQLARIYRMTNRVGLAVRLLRDFPKEFEAMRLLGEIVAESGQHEEAVRVFRKVLLLHLNNSVLDVVDTLPAKKVLRSKVRDPRTLMDLANAYFRTSQFVEAANLYEIVTEGFPSHASGAENNLGVIAFSRGHIREAGIHFRRALALDPDNEAAAMALAHLQAAHGDSQILDQVIQ